MSMLKRLIRELFSEQLNIKARMTTLETAANTKHEAAEDYRVGKTSSSSGTGGTSSSRRSVHVSGHVSAAGLLAWSRVSSSITVDTAVTNPKHHLWTLTCVQSIMHGLARSAASSLACVSWMAAVHLR